MKKTESQADHDVVTGLMNISNFRKKLEETINAKSSDNIVLLLCGIDGLKSINSLFGTDTGDFVLKKTAERLILFSQGNYICSRKWGDEFILFCGGYSKREITKKIKRLLAILTEPITTQEYTIELTVSIGISRYPSDSENIEKLFSYADMALVHSKKIGKNNYQFFSKKIGDEIFYTRQILHDLLHVLDRNELFLRYQPIVDLCLKRIVGFEATLRWKHPIFGLIAPQDFIPLMESSYQILLIGSWTLRQACLQAKLWQKIDKEIYVSVNTSIIQIMSNLHGKNHFINVVMKSLEEAGLLPGSLNLEITESMMMQNDKVMKYNFNKIKALGVGISCDDFGKGYASFTRLKEIPFDTLKIDQSLIQDLSEEPKAIAILNSIITLAQQLEIQPIAEGVNHVEQIRILQSLGCHLMQGYYFSKPVSPDKATRLLKKPLTLNNPIEF